MVLFNRSFSILNSSAALLRSLAFLTSSGSLGLSEITTADPALALSAAGAFWLVAASENFSDALGIRFLFSLFSSMLYRFK